MTKFIFLGNFLGLPSLSVPAGADDNGLPVGFLLTGNHWSEASLLKIGNTLESELLASTDAGAQAPKPPCYIDIMEHNHREDIEAVEAVAEPEETTAPSADSNGAAGREGQEPSDPAPPSSVSAGGSDSGTEAVEEPAADDDTAVDAP